MQRGSWLWRQSTSEEQRQPGHKHLHKPTATSLHERLRLGDVSLANKALPAHSLNTSSRELERSHQANLTQLPITQPEDARTGSSACCSHLQEIEGSSSQHLIPAPAARHQPRDERGTQGLNARWAGARELLWGARARRRVTQ